MANRQDVAEETYFSGDDLLLKFTVLQPSGDAKDISGATLTWFLCKAQGKAPIVTLENADFTVTDAAAGECEVLLPGTETALLGGRAYWHELQVEDSAGRTSTVVHGDFYIEKDALVV